MSLAKVLLSVFLLINAAGVLWAYWDIWRRRSTSGTEALLISVLLLIPLLGFLLFLWVLRAPQPQPSGLMGNMPRGEYTHRMISQFAVLERAKPESHQSREVGDGDATGDSK